MINNSAAYKNETPHTGPFVITQCFTNGTVILQYGAIIIRHSISQIKPCKSDTKVDDICPKNMSDDVRI